MIRDETFHILKNDVEREMVLLKPSHLLDIGCGTGKYFPTYGYYARRVTAIDFSVRRVDIALQYCEMLNMDIEISKMNFIDNHFKDNEFDTSLCVDVLLHIPPNMLNHFISEILRVTAFTSLIYTWYSTRGIELANHCFQHDYPTILERWSKGWDIEQRKVNGEEYLFKMMRKSI